MKIYQVHIFVTKTPCFCHKKVLLWYSHKKVKIITKGGYDMENKRSYVGLFKLLKYSGIIFALTLVLVLSGTHYAAKAAENEVRLNVGEAAIAKDGVFRLRAYNVPANARILFRSSDTSVAYVDNRGYITGISNGECIVTATVVTPDADPQILKCNVTVGPAAVSIKLTKSELVLSVGMKKLLKTIVSPLNTVENPVFYSSEKDVASVSSIGRVRAKSVGTVEVYAFLMNGESAECVVYVLSDEDYEAYEENGTLEGIIEDYGVEKDPVDEPEDDEEEEPTEEKETPED